MVYRDTGVSLVICLKPDYYRLQKCVLSLSLISLDVGCNQQTVSPINQLITVTLNECYYNLRGSGAIGVLFVVRNVRNRSGNVVSC